jgi:hypothetical protein
VFHAQCLLYVQDDQDFGSSLKRKVLAFKSGSAIQAKYDYVCMCVLSSAYMNVINDLCLSDH